jgi:AcrR family transcriptional regulator
MTATAKAAPRRSELLDVAIACFYEKGYAQTTLQDIADRMGFTKAAIYYYAKNKEELLVEIYSGIVEPAIANARALIDESEADAESDGATVFVALIEQHLRTFLSNVEANAVFEVQNVTLSDPAKKQIQALSREYNNILLDVCEKGMTDGSITAGNAVVKVNATIGMCNSAHRWYRPGGKFTVDEVIQELAGIVEAGIRTGSRTAR